MNELLPWDPEHAATRIQALKHLPGALLPVLHALNEAFGYIDDAAVPLVADALNLSQADVHGTISFYHDFRRTPRGQHRLQLCRGEACQAMGCEATIRHVEQRLGVRLGETTSDRRFTVDQVFCLGNCALSPAAMLDGQPHGRVDASAVDAILERAGSRP